MKKVVLAFNVVVLFFGYSYAHVSMSLKEYTNDKSEKMTIVSEKSTNIISRISIYGLQNVKKKSVLSVINLKRGRNYSVDKVREDVRSIFELGCFENVDFSFNSNSGELTFVVVEKPYIERIVFKGNSKFSTLKLKNVAVLKERNYYDLLKLNETKIKLNSLYVNRGYSDCKIELYSTINSTTNRAIITFLITENNKIVVGEIRIEGVESFRYKKLLKIIKTKTRGIYNEDRYAKDLKAIEAFYKDNGFMDYKLVDSTITHSSVVTEVSLKMNISEGKKYKIGSINCNGNFAVGSKKINKIIKIKKWQIFNQQKIIKMIQDIKDAYFDKGYLFVVIDSSFNKKDEDGIVDVSLSIKENSVIYVGNIYIDDLISTKDKVIRREILVIPGDILSKGKILRSVERIYNLGFIESVEPKFFPIESSNIMDIVFSVNEGKAGTINAGVGYSSLGRFLGTIQVQHMNILGLGQKLNLLWELDKRNTFVIDWVSPWIFGKNANLTLSAFSIEKTKGYGRVTKAYDEDRVGFSINVSPKLGDYVSLLFGYRFEHIKLSKIEKSCIDITSLVKNQKDKVSSVFARCLYDSRDYIFDPSKGSRHLLSMQVASDLLGGNVNFVKGTISSTLFFPTFWKFILTFNSEVDAITSYASKGGVPIYERFYSGGADTVRGYEYRTEIGPKDGGKVKGIINVEYKFPIVAKRGRTILQGALFCDIGGAWKDFKRVNLSLGSHRCSLRSGIGFSIRIVTPIFPLRFDWGYGLNHKKNEKLYQSYVNIGSVF
ncbi:MAG: outer membrane protein assembly factor BamA [Endomicrobium sp.]|jgi:outer membrane protein insertion porin family|nr:outer membrane protein assembly factor BamA [Endomicrobium sp.]